MKTATSVNIITATTGAIPNDVLHEYDSIIIFTSTGCSIQLNAVTIAVVPANGNFEMSITNYAGTLTIVAGTANVFQFLTMGGKS